jgi:predicted ATPase
MNQAEARYAGLAHVGTSALGNLIAAFFYLMRGDRSRAAARGAELSDLARQHELQMWRTFAAFFDYGAPPGDAARTRENMRRGIEQLRAQNIRIYDGLLKSALAEEEAKAGNFDGAIEVVDEALATSARIGHRTFDAELHRLRGEVLWRRDPDDRAPAEDGGRCFGARASRQKKQRRRSLASGSLPGRPRTQPRALPTMTRNA